MEAVMNKFNKKKFIAIILSILFFGNKNSNIKIINAAQNLACQKLNYLKKFIASSIATFGIITIIGAIILKIKNSSEPNSFKKNWEKVAEFYKIAAAKESKRSPEYYEHMADYYRCLMYEDLKTYKLLKNNLDIKSKKLDINCKKSQEFYKKASELYSERANKISNEQSYDFQINYVKSAEVLAKAQECWCEAGEIIHDKNFCNHCCRNYDSKKNRTINCCSFFYAAEKWQKVKNIKKSYNAYADAKYYESLAKYKNNKKSWEDAAEAWEKVKSDKDLKESFSEKSWNAYFNFAESKRQECILNYKKTDEQKQIVIDCWLKTGKSDLEVNNSAIHEAFAAEAYQKALDIQNLN